MTIDTFGCRGNTIKVAAGHYFDFDSMQPESIDLYSIAHALSYSCRFGGHTPKYYSIAEHCILAARLANKDRWDDETCLAVLMHDAAEAYIGDMVRPLKNMMPEFREMEAKVEQAIGKRFGIDFGKHHDVIKHYDMEILKAEKNALWPDGEQWNGFEGVADRAVRFRFDPPGFCRQEFINLARVWGAKNAEDQRA